MSGKNIMLESMTVRDPYMHAAKVVHDTVELAEMTEAVRKEKGLPKGAIMVYETKVFHAGVMTSNGRLYHQPLMRAEVARLSEDIKERRVKGLAGHPEPDAAPDPSNACLVPLGLWMEEDGSGHMRAAIPDTTKGRDLAALIRMDTKVGHSQRGRGRSNKVEFTDKHPYFSGNERWAGKTVEDVSDHYFLETFDWVDNPAVHDAELSSYQESESTMSFKIEDLTKEQWAQIKESETFKTAIADATKDLTADHVRQLAESDELAKLLADNTTLVEALAQNKSFTDAVLAEFDDGEPEDEPAPAPEEKKVECTTCKKQIVENSVYCGVCGARQVVMAEGQEPDQPVDAKDKAITSLTEANTALTTRLDERDAKDKAREDKDACHKVITEGLQDKPTRVQEAVRKTFDRREKKAVLNPETIKEDVKEEIEFVESLLPEQADDDTGQGDSQPADEQRPEVLNESGKDGKEDTVLNEAVSANMDLLDFDD